MAAALSSLTALMPAPSVGVRNVGSQNTEQCRPLKISVEVNGLSVKGSSVSSAFMTGQKLQQCHTAAPLKKRVAVVVNAQAQTEVEIEEVTGETVGRREAVVGIAALITGVLSSNSSALAAKAPKGYSAILDNADGYAFFYPFGWQEVAVKGQDVALKDVIEPLESVSVSIIKTDKISLKELGSPQEVAKALVEKVLSSPTQKVSLVSANEKTDNDKTYYQFEFVAKAKNFTRHALGAVAIKDGKFYTLTTGANERRWSKMEEKLRIVVDSFTTL